MTGDAARGVLPCRPLPYARPRGGLPHSRHDLFFVDVVHQGQLQEPVHDLRVARAGSRLRANLRKSDEVDVGPRRNDDAGMGANRPGPKGCFALAARRLRVMARARQRERRGDRERAPSPAFPRPWRRASSLARSTRCACSAVASMPLARWAGSGHAGLSDATLSVVGDAIQHDMDALPDMLRDIDGSQRLEPSLVGRSGVRESEATCLVVSARSPHGSRSSAELPLLTPLAGPLSR